jgi:uncharacterized Ntn-hydrolase superfamily protein
MTFSIIARDPDTGAFGIACETHFFGVGRLVGWLEPGVGVVATQAFVNVGFGPRGVELLKDGVEPTDAVAQLLDGDDSPDVRQLAMIGPDGAVANYTGAACVAAAGALAGDQVSVQGNMLASDSVCAAMLEAYERAAGAPFAARLLAALRAGEDAGGDARGSQSAVLKIVSGNRGGDPWNETLVDIRVDDHQDPVAELTRLAGLSEAYDRLGGVMFAPRVMIGEYRDVAPAELDQALTSLEEAEAVLGDNLEAAFWHAVLLGRAGRVAEASDLFQHVFRNGPHWRPYLDSVAAAGFIDPETVATVVSQ